MLTGPSFAQFNTTHLRLSMAIAQAFVINDYLKSSI